MAGRSGNRRAAALLLVATVVGGCSSASVTLTGTMPPSATASPLETLLATLAPTTAPTTTPAPTTAPTPSPAATATPQPIVGTTQLPGGLAFALSKGPLLGSSASDAKAAGSAVNAFGLDLYRRLAASKGNLVLSPTSIAIALAMMRAGAKGATASEMDAVLHAFGSEASAAQPAALSKSLAADNLTAKNYRGETGQVTLNLANTSFAQRGLAFRPAYLDALSSRFGAGVGLVDFKAEPDGARKLINGWVKDRTAGRIPEILAPGSVDARWRIALVNALYLKAPWYEPFMPEATEDAPFTRGDGSKVTVKMMSTESNLRYAKGTGWQAIDLQYVGKQLSMSIVLPDNMTSFEAGFDRGRLDAIVGSFAPRLVALGLPRFSAGSSLDLLDTLGAMGMPKALGLGTADFSGITGDEPLCIGAVVHQANIDVGEKGTEAAAATVVGGIGGASPVQPVILRIDRPFLFLIRDAGTGAVLFLGRIDDPNAGY